MNKAHTIEDCPQAPTLAEHRTMMQAHGDTLTRLDDSYKRVAIALEEIARRGAQVDSLEKRVDLHRGDIEIAFKQIRNIDLRVTCLEVDKARWDGFEQAEEKQEAINEKKEIRIWTKLERITLLLQVITPLLIGLFFLFWMLDKYEVITSVAKLWREMIGR